MIKSAKVIMKPMIYIIACLFFVITGSASLTTKVLAQSFTQDEINAINNYPNWVAEPGAGETATIPPTSCSPNPVSGTGTVVDIYNYFVSKGMNATAIAGILGNMWAESGLETERLQGPGNQLVAAQSLTTSQLNDSNLGWGLVQWTPPKKIVTPLLKQGQNPNDLTTQITFLWQQSLVGTKLLTSLNQATSTDVSTQAFYVGYEQPYYQTHPLTTTASDSLKQRQAAAKAFYNFLVNGVPLPPGMNVSGTISTAAGGGCTTAGTDLSACQNPLRSIQGLKPLRIDQGVDYEGTGPVYAICPGIVTGVWTTNSGWPGNGTTCGSVCNGTFIKYKLTAGPASGFYVYFAEDCKPTISQGQSLTTSTVICNMYEGGTNIETGWTTSAAGQATLCQSQYLSNGRNNFATTCGQNFSAFMKALGAPAGIIEGNTGSPTLAGYPTWQ